MLKNGIIWEFCLNFFREVSILFSTEAKLGNISNNYR